MVQTELVAQILFWIRLWNYENVNLIGNNNQFLSYFDHDETLITNLYCFNVKYTQNSIPWIWPKHTHSESIKLYTASSSAPCWVRWLVLHPHQHLHVWKPASSSWHRYEFCRIKCVSPALQFDRLFGLPLLVYVLLVFLSTLSRSTGIHTPATIDIHWKEAAHCLLTSRQHTFCDSGGCLVLSNLFSHLLSLAPRPDQSPRPHWLVRWKGAHGGEGQLVRGGRRVCVAHERGL